MNLETFSWSVFAFLAVLCLVALVFAIPLKTRPVYWLIAIILIASLIWLGLLLAQAIGLQASVMTTWFSGQPPNPRFFGWAISLGLVVGIVLISIIRLIRTAFPQIRTRFTAELKFPIWKRLVIAFYSGVLEEIIFRLFLLSLIAWLLGRVWQTADGRPAIGAIWLSNLLAAILFGIVHLPRWSSLTRLSPGFILLIIAMNGLGGIAFGYLFVTYGIEAAIIAHFIGDSLLHIIGPNIITT